MISIVERRGRGAVARPLLYVCIITGYILCAAPCRAQKGITVGPTIGYSYGVPTTVEREAGVVNRYGVDRPGRSYDHQAWFGAGALIPFSRDLPFKAFVETGLALSTGKFVSDPFTFGTIFHPDSLIIVSPLRTFEVTSALSMGRLKGEIFYDISDLLAVGAGLWLDYRVTSDFRQTESLVDHPELSFEGGSRTRLVAAGESLGSDRLRYGGSAGVAAMIPLSTSMTLRPSLDARVDIGALTEGLGFRAVRGGVGVALLFGTGDTRNDTEPAPARTPVTGSIDLFAEDRSQTVRESGEIRVKTTLHRMLVPLFPDIYFDEGSDELSAGYALSADGSDFTLRSLARKGGAEVIRRTPDIIGSRLRSDGSASIVLTGRSGADEPEGLGLRRAEKIRSYLASVWKIAASRIDCRNATPGDGGSDRSVTWSSSPKIEEPVVVEWLVTAVEGPRIGLLPRLDGDPDITRWSLTLRYGDRTVATYRGTNLGELDSLPLAFPVETPGADGSLPDLIADLTLTDSSGTNATFADRLPLTLSRRGGNGKIDREVITAFVPETGPTAGGKESVMEEIARTIRRGAHITIYPGRGRSSAARLASVASELLRAVAERGSRIGGLEVKSSSDEDPESLSGPDEGPLASHLRIEIDQSAAVRE